MPVHSYHVHHCEHLIHHSFTAAAENELRCKFFRNSEFAVIFYLAGHRDHIHKRLCRHDRNVDIAFSAVAFPLENKRFRVVYFDSGTEHSTFDHHRFDKRKCGRHREFCRKRLEIIRYQIGRTYRVFSIVGNNASVNTAVTGTVYFIELISRLERKSVRTIIEPGDLNRTDIYRSSVRSFAVFAVFYRLTVIVFRNAFLFRSAVCFARAARNTR